MKPFIALVLTLALLLGCKKKEDESFEDYKEDPPALAKLIEGPRPTATKDDLARIFFWQERPVKEHPTVEDKETYTVMMTMLTDGTGLEVVKDTTLWKLGKHPWETTITKDGKYLIYQGSREIAGVDEPVQLLVARQLATGKEDTLQGRPGDVGVNSLVRYADILDFSKRNSEGRPLPRKDLGKWIRRRDYLDYDPKNEALYIASHKLMFLSVPLMKKVWRSVKISEDYVAPTFLLANGNISSKWIVTPEELNDPKRKFMPAGQRLPNGKIVDIVGKMNWIGQHFSNLDRSKLLIWVEIPMGSGGFDTVLASVGPNGEMLQTVKWPSSSISSNVELSPSGQYVYFTRDLWIGGNNFDLFCRIHWDSLFSKQEWTKEDLAAQSQIVQSSHNYERLSMAILGETLVPLEAKIK